MTLMRTEFAVDMHSENKGDVSCVVTTQLICAFVFAYANKGFLATRHILYEHTVDNVKLNKRALLTSLSG